MEINVQLDLARVAELVSLPLARVRAAVELLEAGNTVPFITRYRKDQTGGLDEDQIRRIQTEHGKQRMLCERKQTILRSIESQGRLTPELTGQIASATTVKWLEDLYLPFKPKKQTRATLARERGLAPLADEILAAERACADLDGRAADFVNPDREVTSAADALLGAGHILAERFSERADLRHRARKIYRKSGELVSTKGDVDDDKAKGFRDYFDFKQPLAKLPPHRVLAINRGERAKALRVKIAVDEAAIQSAAAELLVPPEHPHADFIRGCVGDALARLVLPSLEREARRELTERAETHAVEVFAKNLRNLLLQPPVRDRRVLAIDPGFKNGCKIAALDEFGHVLAHDVVHFVGSDERKQDARKKLVEVIRAHSVSVVAIGNGTACRETEEIMAELIAGELADVGVSYVVVNEAGASVYSASPLAREELPDFDATIRGAVSIGRRLQDPLSELVKIDAANIGVGMYQHDVKAKHLRTSLDAVVESCVNFVGVNLNTASPALLRYVSGLNGLTARKLYEHRVTHGPFKNRKQLTEVSGFGDATFVQAAGFLKISAGDQPLDATWIHPESYDVAEKVLARLDGQASDIAAAGKASPLAERLTAIDRAAVAQDLDVGELLLADIIASLSRPGRDPREDLPPPNFRKDVVKLEDLSEGMELKGTILNVVDFGAFVDIGLHDSGLVHISNLTNRYVRDPHEVVSVGDPVRVWVKEIDKNRRRVALTMIEPGSEKPPERRRPKSRSGECEKKDSQATDGEKPRRERRRGKRPDGGRTDAASKRPPVRRKPKPVVPITKEMAEGREPMRTFGDLIQFYEKKKPEEK